MRMYEVDVEKNEAGQIVIRQNSLDPDEQFVNEVIISPEQVGVLIEWLKGIVDGSR